jgi:hypothetical protein
MALYFMLWGSISIVERSSASPLFVGAAAGIHMGNHNGLWNSDLRRYIDGRNSGVGGKWPSVIVFLTRQAYSVNRTSSPDCRITQNTVSVRPELKDYLQAASTAGVKIILRIYPSPGNFNADRSLSLASTPADSGSMCGNVGGKRREEVYRSYSDIVDEMVAIHNWNVANGITEHGFVPANEPNNPNEGWYPAPNHICPYTTNPLTPPNYGCINNAVVWQQMDDYFAKIVLFTPTSVKVLTPPMDQMWYAQNMNVVAVPCANEFGGGLPMLAANGERLTSAVTNENMRGYELMAQVFYNGDYNDGYAWHNYWNLGKEPWAGCADFSDQGMHVSMYFPSAMQSALAAKRSSNRPSFILEADLSSPQQNFGNPLIEKDTNNGFDAKASLNDFLSYEQQADYATVWNLNSDDGDNEQKWHQGYARTSPTCYLIRTWFARW